VHGETLPRPGTLVNRAAGRRRPAAPHAAFFVSTERSTAKVQHTNFEVELNFRQPRRLTARATF
jgi:hypothetical protein